VIIHHVWHHGGATCVPEQFRTTPFDLSDEDLAKLTSRYAVMLYREDPDQEMVLALDDPRGRFRQR